MTISSRYDMHPFTHVRPPGTGDEVLALLPADLIAALTESRELRARADQAFTDAAQALADVGVAERADADALAASIRAGAKDPGPVHTTKAKAKAAEAERQASGLDEAAFLAASDFVDLLRAVDRPAIVADLERRAQAKADEALAAFAAAEAARDELLELRNLSLWIDAGRGPKAYPGTADAQERGIARTTFLDDIAGIMLPRPTCIEPPVTMSPKERRDARHAPAA